MSASSAWNSRHLFLPHVTLLAGLAAMIALWPATQGMRPASRLLGPPPADAAIPALGLGDAQAYFRAAAVGLFNAGDLGGRTTPLAAFDMDDVAAWLRHLDVADPRSDLGANLAAHYFGLTPRTGSLRPLIDYLVAHAETVPGEKWRWLAHATFLARHRLGDSDLALELGLRLSKLPADQVPAWARQLPAFVLAAKGDRQAATLFMETMLDTDRSLSAGERATMLDFLRRNAQEMHKP